MASCAAAAEKENEGLRAGGCLLPLPALRARLAAVAAVPPAEQKDDSSAASSAAVSEVGVAVAREALVALQHLYVVLRRLKLARRGAWGPAGLALMLRAGLLEFLPGLLAVRERGGLLAQA